MWFKQAQIYQMSQPLALDAIAFEERLASLMFRPCLPSMPSSAGFTSPFNTEDGPLVHAANGYFLFCLQTEEKILPASVVRYEVNEKVKAIKSQFDRRVGNKEKLQLKDEITQTLLPRAFSKFSKNYAYIDTKSNWLIVDTTTQAKVQKLFELLARQFPEIDFYPVPTKKISSKLTSWLINEDYPMALTLEDSCVLRDPAQATRVIRCQHQDVLADQIISLLKEGCEVYQLSLAWQDRIKFNLADDFGVRNIKFEEKILELAKNQYSESEHQQFDADFVIMTSTMHGLWHDLIKELGEGSSEVEQVRSPEMAEA